MKEGLLMIVKDNYKCKATYRLFNEFLEIWIAPYDGMNIYQMTYKNTPLVKFYPDRLKAGKTCSVMTLFPTPNRTRNFHFLFEGKQYKAYNHGIVRHARFHLDSIESTVTGGIITAHLDIKKHGIIPNTYYLRFPFACRLTLQIELKNQEVIYRYSVQNLDNKNLPFGIAIHPFFEKNNQEVFIQVNAASVMKADEYRLPTGEILPVHGPFDLQEKTNVDSLSLDHVYCSLTKQPTGSIYYPDKTIHLTTSEEFQKMVIYTPKNSNFFCLENQTCSTDAINLYTQGLKKESSLLILAPNEVKQGFIKFQFE